MQYHVNSVATNGPSKVGDSYVKFTDGSFVFNAQLPNAPNVLYMSITKTGERVPTAEYNGSAAEGDRGRLVIPDGANRRVALDCLVK